MKIYNHGFSSSVPGCVDLKGECDACSAPLERWYFFVISKIEKYLPKGFKHLCCHCTFTRAMKILPVCPKCGHKYFLFNTEYNGVIVSCNCHTKAYGDVPNQLRKYREESL